jgi:cation diffusion facilitator family transporter
VDKKGHANSENNEQKENNKDEIIKSTVSKKEQANKEKIRIAITSIAASLILTLIKFLIGIFTNSLGLLSEAMHSGLDVIAAVMTFYAVKMTMKPPDIEHNYGHGKFESLASLAEVILLFVAAAWILNEGISRILFKHIEPDVTIFSFTVLITSIVVDFGRSRALYRVAHKYGSQALEADALHFRVDMLTSSIVLSGLAVVYLSGFPNADAYAAIIVSILIVYTSLGLGRRTLDVLLDKAPKGIQSQITESLKGFEGIKNAHKIRVRNIGSETFVDMHIEVPRTFSHDRAHNLATLVEKKIKDEILPNSDVVVHVDAIEDSTTETIKDKIRLYASDFPAIKNIHSIYLSKIIVDDNNNTSSSSLVSPSFSNTNSIETEKDDKKDKKKLLPQFLHLYLDVQMESSLSFSDAHKIIDTFEQKIKNEIPSIKHITTHIETEYDDVDSSLGYEDEKIDLHLLNKIKNAALSVNGVSDCKDIALVNLNSDLHVTLTIRIPSSYALKRGNIKNNYDEDCIQNNNSENKISINEAHNIATKVQNQIVAMTGASRVIVHTEPD